MKVSVSILTYNRSGILEELLTSLRNITCASLEIIVVDNHSTDKTEEVVKEKFPEIRYFKTIKNMGVGARNIGLSNATADYIITLDDDIIGLNDSDIRALLNIFSFKSDVGAICFMVKDFNTGEICNWCHHYKKEEYWNKEFITDEITEGAVAYRKSALEKAGLYPSFFFISYEGVDLLCRLLNNGYKTIYSPKVEIRHRTHQAGRTNWRRYYYDTRNQIWFVARNLPFFFGIKYLIRGLTAMFLYSARDGFLTYWVKGIFHGLRELPSIMKGRSKVNRETIMVLKKIATHRPSLIYTFRQRLLKKEIKL